MGVESGMKYAPEGKASAVVGKGEFRVGVIGLEHGHIYGMCKGLREASAEICMVYDPDEKKVEAFRSVFPEAVPSSPDDIYNDQSIRMIACASIASERAEVGMKTLDSSKDFFSDKPPFVSQKQVDEARRKVEETGRRWFVYYSERLHVEAAVYAEKLIRDKAIGDVVEIRGWGPHRIGSSERPGWFYEKDKYGGILTDIGSHQLEQILTYAGASDATLIASRVGNLHHKAHPGLEDFGDAMFVTDNGIPCYVNVDWFTPDGLGSWGDGRMIIIGTKGYIELRKYIDVAAENTPDHVILVDDKAEYHYKVNGKVGYPFFSAMILDCINGTETAIKQEHVFKAIELAIEAEDKAIHI